MPIIGFIIAVIIVISVLSKRRSTGNEGQKQPGLTDSVLRAMELEKQQRAAQQYAQYRNTQQVNRGTAQVPEKPVIAHSTDDCTGGSIHDGYHEGTIRKPGPASSAEGMQGAQGVRRGAYAAGTTGQGMQYGEGVTLNAARAAKTRNGQPTREELIREYQENAEYRKQSAAHSVTAPSPITAPKSSEPVERGMERLAKTIADKPPMVQGIIWSEILGRPLSDG